MPALIVNADDFGWTEGINRGVLEAHARGIVSSTTVMVNQPAAAGGIELALTAAPDLGLGLHLNLTAGTPALPAAEVPSLVDDDGRFFGPAQFWERTFVPAEIEAELRAQFARFRSLAGRLPTHLDSHHGITDGHPDARLAAVALALEHGLPTRRFEARDAAEPLPRMPQQFIHTWFDQHAILGELLLHLVDLPQHGITELMCHPGYAAGLTGDPYTVQRERELAALTHPSAREVIDAHHIKLITFAELAG